jgi:hypothetical protein
MFSLTPRPKKRLSAFIGSVCVHCTILLGLASVPGAAPPQRGRDIARRYTVRFLYMPAPRVRQQPVRAGSQSNSALNYRPISGAPADAADSRAKSPARHYRPFELPPSARMQHVKQTLVQPDLPPNLPPMHNISVPAILLWTQKTPPPFPMRKFVAPPLKEIFKVHESSLPSAPSLNTPNGEVAISDLRIANAMINELPRLQRMPATTSPVRIPGPDIVAKIPQIVLPDSSQSNVTNVISLPDIPLRSTGTVVLPPANQIADSGGSGSGSGTGVESNSGRQGAGQGDAAHSGIQATGGAGTQGHGVGLIASAHDGVPGTGTGPGVGVGVSAGALGSSVGTGAADGSGTALGFDSSEVTRITLPKEGKYGVLILGSEAAAPYPESVGVLGGKLVYTVYLKVGLRKSWILQYCLPRDAEPKTHAAGTAKTPLEAPYPFFIMRPNTLDSQEPDYVLVHGMVTADGKFDKLTLIFPEDLEKKSLLFNSLKLWEFRPAKRDGENTSVEVLLIIPRQS